MNERPIALNVKHADQYTKDDLYEEIRAFERALAGYRRAVRAAPPLPIDRALKLLRLSYSSTNRQRDLSNDSKNSRQ